MEFITVLTTASSREEADRIANLLLELRLAGCVQIVENVRSKYWWEGKIEESQEFLLLIKTTKEQFERVERTIKSVHTYEVPEIVALPIVKGSSDYLEWLKGEVG